MFLKLIKINLGRRRATHHLLQAKIEVSQIDIIMIQGPNIKLVQAAVWQLDTRAEAATIILNKNIVIHTTISSKGYIGSTTKMGTFISCYISPNSGMDNFIDFLDRLVNSIREIRDPLTIAGDFNAHFPEWQEKTEDDRGRTLTERAAQHGLSVCNEGNVSTFEVDTRKSIVDIILANAKMILKINIWCVSEEKPMSGHKYINICIRDNQIRNTILNKKPRGWLLKDKDELKVNAAIQNEIQIKNPTNYTELIRFATRICDENERKPKQQSKNQSTGRTTVSQKRISEETSSNKKQEKIKNEQVWRRATCRKR